MYARLFFSIAWNQQQNLHPIWNQWQFDTPFADIDPDHQYYTSFYHNGKLNC